MSDKVLAIAGKSKDPGGSMRNISTKITTAGSKFQVRDAAPCFLVLAAVIAPRALAGASVDNVAVTEVIAESNGANTAYFVYVNGAPSGVAACGTVTSSQYRFAVDPTTEVGKTMVANALTAFATGAHIDIYGLGTCGLWPDTESAERIVLHY
jgi:hypothetical protein